MGLTSSTVFPDVSSSLPVDVPLAGVDGAGVAATRGDDHIGGSNDLIGPGLGNLSPDIPSDLGHGGDGCLVDLVGRLTSSRKDVDSISAESLRPSCGHLRASGIVDAKGRGCWD